MMAILSGSSVWLHKNQTRKGRGEFVSAQIGGPATEMEGGDVCNGHRHRTTCAFWAPCRRMRLYRPLVDWFWTQGGLAGCCKVLRHRARGMVMLPHHRPCSEPGTALACHESKSPLYDRRKSWNRLDQKWISLSLSLLCKSITVINKIIFSESRLFAIVVCHILPAPPICLFPLTGQGLGRKTRMSKRSFPLQQPFAFWHLEIFLFWAVWPSLCTFSLKPEYMFDFCHSPEGCKRVLCCTAQELQHILMKRISPKWQKDSDRYENNGE